ETDMSTAPVPMEACVPVPASAETGRVTLPVPVLSTVPLPLVVEMGSVTSPSPSIAGGIRAPVQRSVVPESFVSLSDQSSGSSVPLATPVLYAAAAQITLGLLLSDWAPAVL